MLRPKKMKKARVIVLRAAVEKLIRDLHEGGVVDITKAAYEGMDEGRPLASFEELSAQLLKLRGVMSLMEANLTRKRGKGPAIIEAGKALEEAKGLGLEPQLRGLSQDASMLSEQIRELESKALVIDRILQFGGVDFSRLSTKKLGYRVGEVAQAVAVKDKLEKIGDSTVASKPGSNVILALYDRKDEDKVDSLLSDAGFNQFDIPEGTTTPFDTINRLNAENEDKKTKLAAVKKKLIALSDANIEKVKTLLLSLEVEAERAEIASRFSSSKYLYVLEGWILEEDYGKLRGIVEKYGNEAMLEEAHFGHGEMPPTVLDNPKGAGPFEFITKSYSLPNYYELDPTIAYVIMIPLLYGMIVGDVLYGVVSLLLSRWLMKKFKDSYTMYNVSMLWFYAAFPTIMFGIIFDEWGGMSHYALLQYLTAWTGIAFASGPLYTGFHRMENILTLVAITVLVGIVHLGLGFVLGAVNEWNHNRKHAYAKIAWLGVELGGLLALVAGLGMLPQFLLTAGLVMLVVSVIVIAMTEGLIGVIELPGILGNILSYTRIAAIGIVGIVIAELLNEFLKPLPAHGLFLLVLIPLYLVLHVVNCFIAMFESIIQGGRLNIVEFKSKFLHGGGVEFNPFALRSKKY